MYCKLWIRRCNVYDVSVEDQDERIKKVRAQQYPAVRICFRVTDP